MCTGGLNDNINANQLKHTMQTTSKKIVKDRRGRVTSFHKLIGILLVGLTSLTSCAFPIAQTVEVTRVVHETVIVTELLVVVITTTPAGVNTPGGSSAASTPNSFMVWDSQQVVEAFRSAGVEVANPRPMTSDDYGLVPMLAFEATRFFIPSICSDCGGRILRFSNAKDLTIV